jgi:hypothetical protein
MMRHEEGRGVRPVAGPEHGGAGSSGTRAAFG